MSATDLATYVNTSAGDAFVQQCWTEAEALVYAYVGGEVGATRVPVEVLGRATLEVGAELFHRRQAPGGITQFATVDGASPVRMARDPMVGAYPILRPFLPGGFA